jgi:hypothetical protein
MFGLDGGPELFRIIISTGRRTAVKLAATPA